MSLLGGAPVRVNGRAAPPRAPARAAALALGLATLGCGSGAPPAAAGARESPAAPPATARYLANEGVLITAGETRVAFDPIFRRDYGQYQLLPAGLERALFAGEPPFDGLDAILISHYHDDHFSADDLRRLLERRPEIRLYAPEQAIDAMRRDDIDPGVAARMTGIALDLGEPPVTIEEGALLIEAVRIPHSGWPERSADVQNLVYRVTLDARATVMHLGDADARDAHFARDAAHWDSRHTHLAFPPFWFFLTEEGRRVVDERLAPGHAVGVHVPVDMPQAAEERPEGLHTRDIFLVPGELREIGGTDRTGVHPQ